MHIYFMSLFCMPRQVRLSLEKIQRDFLWGRGALVQKPHLVRWKMVCLEKKKGGLGVRNLSLTNIALLCKWSWWYVNEREALWKQVISQNYGEENGGWRSREVRERFGVRLWKAIRKEWKYLSGRLAYQVGNGQRVRFWLDKWCGDEPLSEWSLHYLPFLCLRKLGWRMFGTLKVKGVVEPFFSLGPLMIGN